LLQIASLKAALARKEGESGLLFPSESGSHEGCRGKGDGPPFHIKQNVGNRQPMDNVANVEVIFFP